MGCPSRSIPPTHHMAFYFLVHSILCRQTLSTQEMVHPMGQETKWNGRRGWRRWSHFIPERDHTAHVQRHSFMFGILFIRLFTIGHPILYRRCIGGICLRSIGLKQYDPRAVHIKKRTVEYEAIFLHLFCLNVDAPFWRIFEHITGLHLLC